MAHGGLCDNESVNHYEEANQGNDDNGDNECVSDDGHDDNHKGVAVNNGDHDDNGDDKHDYDDDNDHDNDDDDDDDDDDDNDDDDWSRVNVAGRQLL